VRLPGRVDSDVTAFTSVNALAEALREAAAAHGEHGQRDENWPDWYAQYLVTHTRDEHDLTRGD
jgi:hypothetical protein